MDKVHFETINGQQIEYNHAELYSQVTLRC